MNDRERHPMTPPPRNNNNRDGLRDKAAVFSREKEKRSEAATLRPWYVADRDKKQA